MRSAISSARALAWERISASNLLPRLIECNPATPSRCKHLQRTVTGIQRAGTAEVVLKDHPAAGPVICCQAGGGVVIGDRAYRYAQSALECFAARQRYGLQ